MDYSTWIPLHVHLLVHFDVLFVTFSCSSTQGPLMFYVTKLYPSPDATVFYAFGRVISGIC